ncbi:MAG: PHP domain-containing protein [Firmicutes bacterium]|nr:PHP domain-containing protein [Bacillota bacterium]
MRNRDVAEMLERAGRILSLRGENRYRIRAYQKAARAVVSLDEGIDVVVKEKRLQQLEGVGSALAEKIQEIVETGTLSMLERIETVSLPPTKMNRTILLASALTFSTELLPQLVALPGVTQVQVVGEARRRRETVTGLEFALAVSDMAEAKESLGAHKHLHSCRWEDNKCFTVHSFGIEITFHLVVEECFVQTLWQTTGSVTHVQKMAMIIKEKTGQQIMKVPGQSNALQLLSEEELYALANLPLIAPELREDGGEIEAAQAGQLPLLVDAADYKGDLHIHTDWSDGAASMKKMVEAAVELGYEYVAITDHSRSLKIAKGLSLERLSQQQAFIKSLQDKYNIRIFSGIEVDILDDGSIDAPNEVLANLDVVIASVHSAFRQSRAKMTTRICRAMQNPYVQILGHATGRLLGKREPYEVDMAEVLRVAAMTGTSLEINSSPDRLDINDSVARRAKDAGIAVAINTDAHSQLELANMLLGLAMARRGWLEKKDVLNTSSAQDILAILQKKRRKH